jgi:transcriptional regulator with XRE-family HTH domain
MPWNIAERVERARCWRGWTQTELARRAGLHPIEVHKIVKGAKPKVQAETVRRLAIALGLSADYLLGLKDEREAFFELYALNPPAAPPDTREPLPEKRLQKSPQVAE